MKALEEPDEKKSLDAFDRAFWKHVGHSSRTLFRAWGRSWTGGIFAPAPRAAEATKFHRQLSRYAAAFAFTADIALLTMGGALKRKEGISGRLGDILSELYLLSAALKRWEDEGRQQEDLPLLEWCMADGIARMSAAFDGVFANIPSRFAAGLLRIMLPVAGRGGPSDALSHRCAKMILAPSIARDRLTPSLYLGKQGESIAELEEAFLLAVRAEDVLKKIKDRDVDLKAAIEIGIIDDAEATLLKEAKAAANRVVAVDDFDAKEISGFSAVRTETPRSEARPRRVATG